eukprot:gb/GECH01014852.1/.p1 GENE.gb/GECH01014852.1/~~gb/GECH01014852.1/.p1  ORF type:complete len:353 (+),score=89.01 gb/GECH01014852.1/:1-1059(+)
MSDLYQRSLKNRNQPMRATNRMLPPRAPTTAKSKPSNDILEEYYSPISWDNYFTKYEDITIPNTEDKFRVYISESKDKKNKSSDSDDECEDKTETVYICLHGGGYTAMTWALCTKHLKQHHRVIALDLRGHGDTTTQEDTDLSADTLVNDVVHVLNTMFHHQPMNFVLIGHSMGGAIAARTAASWRDLCPQDEKHQVTGLVVVDVVEGSALAALQHMHTFLEKRPQQFSSIEKAIKWSVSSNTIRTLESARVSIPTQVTKHSGKYVWRTDLEATEQYWKGWFTGLSEQFLSSPCYKMLLLAGTDRLDKPLTIAQMQGKFQMQIMGEVGHVIQEDKPKETANTIKGFSKRFGL